MFTVSVRHIEDGSKQKRRTVHECSSYQVAQDSMNLNATITLDGAGRAAPEQIRLSSGEMAYVMNDCGGTVDKIVTNRATA